MPARKGKKAQHGPNRHVEQATEQLATMERELNALRLDLRGRPADEVRTYLSGRYGADLDHARLNDCVAAIVAGREVRLRPPAFPPTTTRPPRRRL